jgi:hypothetical protein
MSQFQKVAKLKYENSVFSVLDVVKFGEVEIVTLDDDFFLVKAKEEFYFVRQNTGDLSYSTIRERTTFTGKDGWGFSCSLDIAKDLASKSWYILWFETNGATIRLEGERILLSNVGLY